MTNGDVIASLVNCSESIISGMDAGVHTFTGNGSYVFNFTDVLGNPGSVVATVENIDKNDFDVVFSYEPQNPHSGNITVIASLTSTGGIAPVGRTASGTHQYFTVFSGVAGQDVTLTGDVTFTNYVGTTSTSGYSLRIDRKIPVCEVEYSTTGMVNTDVMAWLVNCSEAIITGSDNGTYIFT